SVLAAASTRSRDAPSASVHVAVVPAIVIGAAIIDLRVYGALLVALTVAQFDEEPVSLAWVNPGGSATDCAEPICRWSSTITSRSSKSSHDPTEPSSRR